jgi:hypothetical protein
VRRVKRIQHLEVSEGCRKECVQGSFLRLRVMESSGRIRPSKLLKDNAREVVTWKFVRRRRKFAPQVDKFHGGTLGHSQKSSKEGTDGRNSLRRIHEFP